MKIHTLNRRTKSDSVGEKCQFYSLLKKIFLYLWPLFSFPFHFSSSNKRLCSPISLLIESAKWMGSSYLTRKDWKKTEPKHFSPLIALISLLSLEEDSAKSHSQAIGFAAAFWNQVSTILTKRKGCLSLEMLVPCCGCTEGDYSLPGNTCLHYPCEWGPEARRYRMMIKEGELEHCGMCRERPCRAGCMNWDFLDTLESSGKSWSGKSANFPHFLLK